MSNEEQQSTERGFGFLKDPLFFTDSVFLKSPERIEALTLIMGLCLLVYTLGQRLLRQNLQLTNKTVKNQLGKGTNRPTLRWIFQSFQSIHAVYIQGIHQVSNLTSERLAILSLFPGKDSGLKNGNDLRHSPVTRMGKIASRKKAITERA